MWQSLLLYFLSCIIDIVEENHAFQSVIVLNYNIALYKEIFAFIQINLFKAYSCSIKNMQLEEVLHLNVHRTICIFNSFFQNQSVKFLIVNHIMWAGLKKYKLINSKICRRKNRKIQHFSTTLSLGVDMAKADQNHLNAVEHIYS